MIRELSELFPQYGWEVYPVEGGIKAVKFPYTITVAKKKVVRPAHSKMTWSIRGWQEVTRIRKADKKEVTETVPRYAGSCSPLLVLSSVEETLKRGFASRRKA